MKRGGWWGSQYGGGEPIKKGGGPQVTDGFSGGQGELLVLAEPIWGGEKCEEKRGRGVQIRTSETRGTGKAKTKANGY